MATNTFDAIAFPFTIGMEGGWDNDQHDRGNWTTGVIGKGELKGTKYGIAAHVYPDLDIKNLTLAEAKAIYQRDYAARVAYDNQPVGVDVSVWDMGVNAGVGRSLALLRGALSSSCNSAKGLASVASALPDKVAVIKGFSARRLSFYQGLKTFSRYGRGWSRRAAECEVLSVKTWLTIGALKPEAEVKKELKSESDKASTASKGHATGGVATGGAEGANASQHTWSFDWTTAIEIALVAVAVAFVVYFIWKAVAHNDRAQAYAAAAKI